MRRAPRRRTQACRAAASATRTVRQLTPSAGSRGGDRAEIERRSSELAAEIDRLAGVNAGLVAQLDESDRRAAAAEAALHLAHERLEERPSSDSDSEVSESEPHPAAEAREPHPAAEAREPHPAAEAREPHPAAEEAREPHPAAEEAREPHPVAEARGAECVDAGGADAQGALPAESLTLAAGASSSVETVALRAELARCKASMAKAQAAAAAQETEASEVMSELIRLKS